MSVAWCVCVCRGRGGAWCACVFQSVCLCVWGSKFVCVLLCVSVWFYVRTHVRVSVCVCVCVCVRARARVCALCALRVCIAGLTPRTVLAFQTTTIELSPPSNWQMNSAYQRLHRNKPSHRRLTKCEQSTWPYRFRKQRWSALGLWRSNRVFEHAWCCLHRLSKWAELYGLLSRGQ